MPGMGCFLKKFFFDLRIPLKPRYKLEMGLYAFLKNKLRVILLIYMHGIKSLKPPAEITVFRALVKCRGHLYALV
jgi:hypothetical protein